MALAVIFVLYAGIGLLAAAGSVFIVRKVFAETREQAFFAVVLIPIAGVYLAFTSYFGETEAWRLEAAGVTAFAILGLLGVRLPWALVLGYLAHGFWDAAHEIPAHAGAGLFGNPHMTAIPLAYGVFCAAYDWSMAAYFLLRRGPWGAARGALAR